MQKIGWIGVGIMGKAMVRNLMKAGYQLHIYARHPEKVADVVSEGAVFRPISPITAVRCTSLMTCRSRKSCWTFLTA